MLKLPPISSPFCPPSLDTLSRELRPGFVQIGGQDRRTCPLQGAFQAETGRFVRLTLSGFVSGLLSDFPSMNLDTSLSRKRTVPDVGLNRRQPLRMRNTVLALKTWNLVIRSW